MRWLLWLFVCLGCGAGVLSADTTAVLPFFNITKTSDLDWIGESLAETTRQAIVSQGLLVLERGESEKVYARLSIRPYALLTRASVIKIGETLEVEEVVYGQFSYTPPENGAPKTKGSLKIAAQVLDLKGMKRSPEFSATGALEDLGRLQSNLAWQTLQYLSPNPSLTEEAFFAKWPPVRVEAMESYTRGLMAQRPDAKVNLLQQATRLDSQFMPAVVELGRVYLAKKDYKTSATWLQKVPQPSPLFREAQFLLGLARYYGGDFAGSANAFQVIATTMPLNEVFNNLGVAQARANVADSLDNLRRAADGDQTDTAYQFNMGYELWKKGDFESAAAHFQNVLDRDPNDQQAVTLLARSLQKSGPRTGDSKLANLERLKEKYEETAYWQLKTLLDPKK